VIHEDIVEETIRLVGAAERDGVVLRLLGGMAIHLHVGDLLHQSLAREIRDIDFVTPKGDARRARDLLVREGYEPDATFNATHGARRLLFYDRPHGRQVDVFVDLFQMCHVLPLSERLTVEPVTLPLAELLLTKLQIVKLNRKDLLDAYALLLSHEVADHDNETINVTRIAELAARDWGLHRTIELTLDRLRAALGEVELDDDQRALIEARLDAIQEAMESAPKTGRWRMRARVGERVRWYEDPDEVDGSA
jgi:putative nucleotidyltransferase-like protein